MTDDQLNIDNFRKNFTFVKELTINRMINPKAQGFIRTVTI